MNIKTLKKKKMILIFSLAIVFFVIIFFYFTSPYIGKYISPSFGKTDIQFSNARFYKNKVIFKFGGLGEYNYPLKEKNGYLIISNIDPDYKEIRYKIKWHGLYCIDKESIYNFHDYFYKPYIHNLLLNKRITKISRWLVGEYYYDIIKQSHQKKNDL